jgi:hypothetical protein
MGAKRLFFFFPLPYFFLAFRGCLVDPRKKGGANRPIGGSLFLLPIYPFFSSFWCVEVGEGEGGKENKGKRQKGERKKKKKKGKELPPNKKRS